MKKILYGIIILLLVALLVFAYRIEKALAASEPEIPQLIIDHPDTCREAAEVIFKDNRTMRNVMKPESGGNHMAKNPYSTAKGCYQILDSTWRGEGCKGDVYNPIFNVKCAKILHDRYGTSPWLESKSVWSKM